MTDVGKCLRAAVTYRDGINVDRTFADADPDPTDDFDPTFEGTYRGTEYPVKALDDDNDAPRFTDNGNALPPNTDDPGTEVVSVYRAERRENATGEDLFEPPATPTLRIIEAFPAVDVETNELDIAPDILTYTLSGRDGGFIHDNRLRGQPRGHLPR